MRFAATLLVLLLSGASLRADETCPVGTREVIADIPLESSTPIKEDTNTCNNRPVEPHTYTGGQACTIQGYTYEERDLYRIYLNNTATENNVRFRLENTTGDLALILVDPEGSCIANSPDFIGVGVREEIPAATYEPSGVYSLYVDTAHDAQCGSYKLFIEGTNPPQINLAFRDDSEADVAIAGESELKHRITLKNLSPYKAENIAINISSVTSDGVQRTHVDPPRAADGTWEIGSLRPPEEESLTVTYKTSPSTITGEVVETSVNYRPSDPPNCGQTELRPPARTTILRKAKLLLTLSGNPEEPTVIAGSAPISDEPNIPKETNLIHTITAKNKGPSTISNLVLGIQITKPSGVTFYEGAVKESLKEGQKFTQEQAELWIWEIEVLEPGDTHTLTLPFYVPPSAKEYKEDQGDPAKRDTLIKTDVTLRRPPKTDPRDEPWLSLDTKSTKDLSLTTRIERQIWLWILQRPDPSTPIVAGDCTRPDGNRRLTLVEKLCNQGPSNASALKLVRTLALPDRVVHLETSASLGSFDEEDCGIEGGCGIWSLDDLPPCKTCISNINSCPDASLATLTSTIEVKPDAGRDNDKIKHAIYVKDVGEDKNKGLGPDDPEKADTLNIIRQNRLQLSFEQIRPEPPPLEVIAGEDTPNNLQYLATLRNEGPSIAEGLSVEHQLTLPGDGVTGGKTEWEPEVLSPACSAKANFEDSSTVTLTVDKTAEHESKVEYLGSVIEANSVTCIDADKPTEKDPCIAEFPAPFSTTIRRHFLLEHGFPADEVTAGESIDYGIRIENLGSPGTVTVKVPDLIDDSKFTLSPPEVTYGDFDDESHEWTIEWTQEMLDAEARPSLSQKLEIARSARGEISEASSPSVRTDQNDDPSIFEPDGLISTIEINVRADLTLEPQALPDPAILGETVTCVLTVGNEGPSDSTEARICAAVPQELELLPLPGGCKSDNLGPCNQPESSGVVCELGALLADDPNQVVRFAAHIPSNLTTGKISTPIFLVGDGAMDLTSEIVFEVFARDQVTDLSLTLGDVKDPVQRGTDEILYQLTVTNLGPAEGGKFKIKGLLSVNDPDLDECPKFCQSCETDCTEFQASNCTPPSENVDCCYEIHLTAIDDVANCQALLKIPERIEFAVATWTVEATLLDPISENDTGTEVTTVLDEGDIDLAVNQSIRPDPAIAGGPARYEITTRNRGLVDVPEELSVVVEDMLPANVGSGFTYQGVEDIGCEEVPGETRVQCEAFAAGTRKSYQIEVDVPEDATSLEKQATIHLQTTEGDDPESVKDPAFNNENTLKTAVVAPLIDPYYQASPEGADGDSKAPRTLLFLRNGAEKTAGIRYRAFDRFGEAIGEKATTRRLPKHATHVVDIGKLLDQGQGPTRGYVGVGPAALSGDAFFLDESTSSIYGIPLSDVASELSPPGLCQHLILGFYNGELFDETEFLFFVPGNFGRGEFLARGRVYSPEGWLIQTVEIPASQPTGSDASEAPKSPLVVTWHGSGRDSLSLPSSYGTIEWTFLDDTVGQVTAVFRSAETAVAVPAFCVEPRAAAQRASGPSSDPHLILPYFDTTEGKTTFAVRNSSRDTAFARYQVFSTDGVQQDEDCLKIPGFGTKLVNLKEEQSGYVEITTVTDVEDCEPGDDGSVLRGEWVHQESGIAYGDVLVDTRDTLLPPNLCRNWSSLFLNGASNVYTRFFFYVREGVVPSGRFYEQSGGDGWPIVLTSEAEDRIAGQRAFILTVQDLQIPRSVRLGTIEWDLGEGGWGHVTTVHQAGTTYSVAVPAICRDGDADDR